MIGRAQYIRRADGLEEVAATDSGDAKGIVRAHWIWKGDRLEAAAVGNV
jgi:hypothetical protein